MNHAIPIQQDERPCRAQPRRIPAFVHLVAWVPRDRTPRPPTVGVHVVKEPAPQRVEREDFRVTDDNEERLRARALEVFGRTRSSDRETATSSSRRSSGPLPRATLNASFDLVRDILKNDTRARAPSNADPPLSYLPNRSFTENNHGVPARDATIYRHTESRSAYKPPSRHVDRNAVRATSKLDSPSADLSDVKRALQSEAQLLDHAAARTAEDDALARDLENLKYRVQRVSEDWVHAARLPRSQAKDDDRHRLERELRERNRDYDRDRNRD
ncbi:hypothetical protein B0H11DRAFT_2298481 [Mycena galericulata]|nr:hypothetical protein B0H11DRAFT_2298481 [Mycena galericulata]